LEVLNKTSSSVDGLEDSLAEIEAEIGNWEAKGHPDHWDEEAAKTCSKLYFRSGGTTEELMKILFQLDQVLAYGDATVKKTRKALVLRTQQLIETRADAAKRAASILRDEYNALRPEPLVPGTAAPTLPQQTPVEADNAPSPVPRPSRPPPKPIPKNEGEDKNEGQRRTPDKGDDDDDDDDDEDDSDEPEPEVEARPQRKVRGAGSSPARFVPAHNFVEEDTDVVAAVKLPGMTLKDISIDFAGPRGDILVVSGVAPESRSGHGGTFEVRFRLPDSIDADAGEASYHDDGVLRIRFPKFSATNGTARRFSDPRWRGFSEEWNSPTPPPRHPPAYQDRWGRTVQPSIRQLEEEDDGLFGRRRFGGRTFEDFRRDGMRKRRESFERRDPFGGFLGMGAGAGFSDDFFFQ